MGAVVFTVLFGELSILIIKVSEFYFNDIWINLAEILSYFFTKNGNRITMITSFLEKRTTILLIVFLLGVRCITPHLMNFYPGIPVIIQNF